MEFFSDAFSLPVAPSSSSSRSLSLCVSLSLSLFHSLGLTRLRATSTLPLVFVVFRPVSIRFFQLIKTNNDATSSYQCVFDQMVQPETSASQYDDERRTRQTSPVTLVVHSLTSRFSFLVPRRSSLVPLVVFRVPIRRLTGECSRQRADPLLH
jgi:hypothetical protein